MYGSHYAPKHFSRPSGLLCVSMWSRPHLSCLQVTKLASLTSVLFFKTIKEKDLRVCEDSLSKMLRKSLLTVTLAWKGHIVFSLSLSNYVPELKRRENNMHDRCCIFVYFYLTSGFTTPHLLFSLKEAFEVICIQVVFMVAVGEHQQVEIAPRWHHLIERAKLLKSQSALVVISVCLLKSEMEKFGVKEHQGESNCLPCK